MNPVSADPGPAAPGTTSRTAPASLIHPLASVLDRLDPAAMFSATQPLEVELGSGDGTFIVEYARLHPDRNFLGVERLLGRLRKIDRKGRRAGLANLRAIRLEASYLVEFLLPPGSIAAIHVYFPDPWPKRKHHRHRLINEHFAEVASRALAPRGTLHLRTDDPDYFKEIEAVFRPNPDFQPVETPGELIAVRTDFEREFIARGKAIRRASYQRC